LLIVICFILNLLGWNK